MQNMHNLTGVYWPIHRGWCRGSGTKGDLSTSTGDTHRGAGWRTEAIIYMYTTYCTHSNIIKYNSITVIVTIHYAHDIPKLF